ncbi:MAG: carbon-nitrogen hydrolase family protein [Planctomycetes bacterium]|nr:carbon-nitrogen hydrolase family protein [Planctomycetota bacterium]
MRIELAQIAIRDGVKEPNLEKVLDYIGKADTAGGTDLVVFPESTLCGFPSADKVAGVAEPWDGPGISAVRSAAKQRGVAVAVGYAEAADGAFYNTSTLIDKDGDVVLQYRKTHLWPTDKGVVAAGNRLPTAMWKGRRVGLIICYDIEFPETARALARQGAELLIVTDGNMDPLGPVHSRALAARAMENQMFVVMTNRTGTGASGMTFPGESTLVDPMGNTVAVAGKDEGVLAVEIDWTLLKKSREQYDYLRDARIQYSLRDHDGFVEIE